MKTGLERTNQIHVVNYIKCNGGNATVDYVANKWVEVAKRFEHFCDKDLEFDSVLQRGRMPG